MPEIHLLNQEDSPLQPRDLGNGLMESGCWRVSVERSQAVVGRPIHLHRRKAAPSYLSGLVTDFRREPYTLASGKTEKRSVFTFTPRADLEGADAGPGGWTLAGVKFIS